MKKIVDRYDFVDEFKKFDREDNFSYDGLLSLYEYLTELEDDCKFEFTLDVIAICCDYTEYANLAEFQQNYSDDEYTDLDAIREHTTVIEIDDERFIVQEF